MKTKSLLEQVLDEPVDLTSLMEKLDFSEENIVEADREQAALYLEASRYRVKKFRGRIQAESALDTAKAKASMGYRAKKKETGYTEAYIKEKIVLDPGVQTARAKYDSSLVHEEWARLLLDAYKERGRAIKTLAEILGAETYAQARLVRKEFESEGFEKLKNAVRKKYTGKGE